MNTVIMSNYSLLWIPDALDRVERAVGANFIGAEHDVLIFGNEEWKERLLIKVTQFLFPTLPFENLRNGFSARQLGAFLGHYYFLLEAFGPICDSVEGPCVPLLARTRELERLKSRLLTESNPAVSLVSVVLRFMRLVLKLPLAMRRIRSVVPIAKETIHTILGEAQVRGDTESREFLEHFDRARRIRTLDSDGRIICTSQKSQKPCEILLVVLVLRDLVRSMFKNAAHLHLAMVKFFLPGRLASDTNDPNWEKEKRSVKSACDSVGLSLGKPGRPRNCK